MATVLGIDIGGSGIKGAPVDVERGELVDERFRLPTPDPAKPEPMAETVAEIARHFNWEGPIGVGFPSVIRGGRVYTAANIHKSWIGAEIDQLLTLATHCPTRAINDADAAGMAEMKFGAGKDRMGVVLLVTIGTGIGTSIFTNGVLVPNTEFGHLKIRDKDAETRASDAARQEKDLSWEKWGGRFNEFLMEMERLIWPDLIILGGGVSKQSEKFLPFLSVKAEIIPASFLNLAGIVGAALAAPTV